MHVHFQIPPKKVSATNKVLFCVCLQLCVFLHFMFCFFCAFTFTCVCLHFCFVCYYLWCFCFLLVCVFELSCTDGSRHGAKNGRRTKRWRRKLGPDVPRGWTFHDQKLRQGFSLYTTKTKQEEARGLCSLHTKTKQEEARGLFCLLFCVLCFICFFYFYFYLSSHFSVCVFFFVAFSFFTCLCAWTSLYRWIGTRRQKRTQNKTMAIQTWTWCTRRGYPPGSRKWCLRTRLSPRIQFHFLRRNGVCLPVMCVRAHVCKCVYVWVTVYLCCYMFVYIHERAAFNICRPRLHRAGRVSRRPFTPPWEDVSPFRTCLVKASMNISQSEITT